MKTLLFRETAVGLHQVKVQKNPIYLLPVANNDSTNTSNSEKNPYIFMTLKARFHRYAVFKLEMV